MPGNRYQLWTVASATADPVANNQFDAGPDSRAFFSGDVDDKVAARGQHRAGRYDPDQPTPPILAILSV